MVRCDSALFQRTTNEVPLWRSSSAVLLRGNLRLCPDPQSVLNSRCSVTCPKMSCQATAHPSSPVAAANKASSECRLLQNRRQAFGSSLSAAVLLFGFNTQPVQAGLIDEQQADNVFSIAGQSVVSIADYKVSSGQEEAEGTGSGFLWDTFGHVVTNYHVVAAAKQNGVLSDNQVIRVGFVNDKGTTEEFPATVVGTDAQHDIAVLLITAPQKTFVPVQIGASAGLRTGQSVYAIGNPYGLSRTLTAGVVSGLNRAIPSPVGTKTYGAIQTDAAISSGNSGGPLLDSAGRVIGINTATFTRAGTGRSSGVNFALPIDLAMKVVPNLIVYGNAAGKGVKGI